MGKKRKVLRVLVVDSTGNAIAPMMASCFNGNFDRSEGSVSYWADHARAFEHDGDSPRTVDRDIWNFMIDRGFTTDGLSKEVKSIDEFDLTEYHLIYCVGTEAYAEVRGATDRMHKRDRPEVQLIEEDIKNPLDDTDEDASQCIDAESESELEATADQRVVMMELLANQIKGLSSRLMTHTPDVEPARR